MPSATVSTSRPRRSRTLRASRRGVVVEGRPASLASAPLSLPMRMPSMARRWHGSPREVRAVGCEAIVAVRRKAPDGGARLIDVSLVRAGAGRRALRDGVAVEQGCAAKRARYGPEVIPSVVELTGRPSTPRRGSVGPSSLLGRGPGARAVVGAQARARQLHATAALSDSAPCTLR